MSADRCTACGPGWECDKPAGKAKGLCPGHYQQQRRKTPLQPLGHKKPREDRIFIGFQTPEANVLRAATLATATGCTASDIYRLALEQGLEQLERKAVIELTGV